MNGPMRDAEMRDLVEKLDSVWNRVIAKTAVILLMLGALWWLA